MKTIASIIALVAMIGFASAGTTIDTFVGDGSYDLTYDGSGDGLFVVNTYTSDGFDQMAVDFDADVSGHQAMDTSSGWTHIDRDSQTNGGYGLISTVSKSGDGTQYGVVATLVTSINNAKIIDQDVDIMGSIGVGVETYHAANDDGASKVGAYGGSTEGAIYTTVVGLNASDHSVLYTNASADYGDSRVDFDTNADGRGLLHGGTLGNGQLTLYTNTEYNFGQEMQGTYDATTLSIDINDGLNGAFTTAVDFDTNCDMNGYGATSYYYSVND
ncbi:hypothetical protein B6U67_04230 [Methanosarcinales archaeon ex4484_138]|nr:MAG: hypothetical protein B6U67_04230 [Methanosarcinales archaeon ex4484_138]